jgi:hypothetical protein
MNYSKKSKRKEIEVWEYGISLIVLNGMMYVGIPIVRIIGIGRINSKHIPNLISKL